MVALDNAGKTTILYKLKQNSFINATPTIGFNLEEIKFEGLSLTIWDIGGYNLIQDNKVRFLFKHYYQNTDGIIFVVDSNDKERLIKAKEAFLYFINNKEFKNVPLLILANKQDLSESISPKELINIFDMTKINNNKWFIQGLSVINGKGLKEGINWLLNELKHTNNFLYYF